MPDMLKSVSGIFCLHLPPFFLIIEINTSYIIQKRSGI